MGLGPIYATKKLCHQQDLRLEDFDTIELNEAFAAQTLACVRQMQIDSSRLNLEGGSAKMEEYIRDVISFCRMFYIGGIANVVHGREHQLDMAEKYPEKWMEILRDEAGEFTL